jgi:hypothetical protein
VLVVASPAEAPGKRGERSAEQGDHRRDEE